MVEVPCERDTGSGLQMCRSLWKGLFPVIAVEEALRFAAAPGEFPNCLNAIAGGPPPSGRPRYLYTVRIRTLITICWSLLACAGVAQEVTIHGQVVAPDGEHSYYDLMIVNKRTRSGTFGNADGSFHVRALRTDTLLVGSIGQRTRMITVADSVEKDSYHILIRMKPYVVELAEVEVLPERTLKEIQKDIERLGYKESDYRISNVDALQSPITFLYQEFSKRERSKRLVAQLQNEDRKRALLQELLQKYVQYDIINLNEEAFDDFIDFCNVPEEVIKGLTQYEFLLYVKKKYELYSSLGPTRRH